MGFKFITVLAACLFTQSLFAQTTLTPFSVNRQMKDTFSFAKDWDYDWTIVKDESGKFFSAEGERIKAKDTVHLYFTAHCSTSVQGGYRIRYCFADRLGDTLRLAFSDGLPAYASSFYIYVVGDRFYFEPKTVYPQWSKGQQLTYKVTKQKMTLNGSAFKPGDTVMGEVDIAFTETFTAPEEVTRVTQHFFKGFIRTPVRRSPTSKASRKGR